MDENNDYEEYDDQPPYQEPSAIDPSALRAALCKLNLLGDDPYLRMQAFNLAIVDQFLMELESQLLQELGFKPHKELIDNRKAKGLHAQERVVAE